MLALDFINLSKMDMNTYFNLSDVINWPFDWNYTVECTGAILGLIAIAHHVEIESSGSISSRKLGSENFLFQRSASMAWSSECMPSAKSELIRIKLLGFGNMHGSSD
jgi:hypothetical protein